MIYELQHSDGDEHWETIQRGSDPEALAEEAPSNGASRLMTRAGVEVYQDGSPVWFPGLSASEVQGIRFEVLCCKNNKRTLAYAIRSVNARWGFRESVAECASKAWANGA